MQWINDHGRAGHHSVTGQAPASISPEGIAFSPNSRYIVAASLTRSFFPWTGPRLTVGGALDLITLDAQSGALKNIEAYPLQGILTEGLAFDASGRFVAVTHFDRFDPRKRRGVVEFWQLVPGDKPRLERTTTKSKSSPARTRCTWCRRSTMSVGLLREKMALLLSEHKHCRLEGRGRWTP